MTTPQVPSCTCTPEDDRLCNLIERFYENLPSGAVAQGLSVGLINGLDSSGNPIITKCYSGLANVEDGTPIAEDTVFEIGSMSKTFTTTMLADAVVNAGTMSLSDTAQSYYDQYGEPVTLPVYTDPSDGQTYPMTLLDLADYTSGIPDKSPTNTGMYGQYSFLMMYEYLNGLGSLPAQPGTAFKYVNTNFGILADLLMKVNGFQQESEGYPAALSSLISNAGLQMPNTGVITGNQPSIPNLAQGYQLDGTVEKYYALPTWPALLGAGGIYSTIDDMLNWLQFNMGLTDSPYNNLLSTLQQVWFQGAGAAVGEGLGWFVNTSDSPNMIFKDGGTDGFHSWGGFIAGANLGVVLLCNSALVINETQPVDQLGMRILRDLQNATPAAGGEATGGRVPPG